MIKQKQILSVVLVALTTFASVVYFIHFPFFKPFSAVAAAPQGLLVPLMSPGRVKQRACSFF